MRLKARRVSRCPYRERKKSPLPRQWWSPFECSLTKTYCPFPGLAKLGDCPRYRKSIYRKFIHMPERGRELENGG
jgi:hypothetical protein